MQITRRNILAAAGTLVGSGLLAESAPGGQAANPAASNPPTPSGSEPVSLSDFEALAQRKLDHAAYEYIAGGAGDEITMRWNREALDALRLRTRVLVDVEHIDTSTTLWNQKLDFPLLLAPTAFHRLAHPEGEVETARGASLGGVTFIISSLSTRRIEEISKVATQPLWFQLYDIRKQRREFVVDVIAKVKAHGCRALVVTADAPVTGARNRSERAHFRLPDDFDTPYYPDRTGRLHVGGLPVSGSSTWDDLAWLQSQTDLPILVKGILNPDDAARAIKMGIGGIIVSNHGGRELDTVPATISVLPAIVAEVAGRVPILMDGGVRRGTDILKALARGAAAVLIGRPYLYGLSIAGAAGVASVTGILKKEFEMAMALTGRRTLAEIDRTVLYD
jgi:4-hydroxymandelate oxidase